MLVCDDVTAPANIGSLFRLAEAFNIEKLVLCGKNINLNSPRLQKTARGTLGKVCYEQAEDSPELCFHLKDQGYTLLALEITDDSEALETVNFQQFEKLALIVGNENLGIQQKTLDMCHKRLHINMFGANSSMNVAQATAIALYEITKCLQSYQ